MKVRKKHVEHTSMLCLSCVAQQSNVMSIEPNWKRHYLGTRNIAWCDERIRQDLLCHHLCRCSRKRHTVRIVRGVTVLPMYTIVQHDTQRKQWKSSCQTSTNLRVRWLSDQKNATNSTKSMCGNACHRLSTVAKLGLVIGSTCRLSSPLDGSQRLTGAFNSHVSPVTQFSAASDQNRTCEVCPEEFHAEKSSTIGLQQQTSTVGIYPAVSCPPLPEKRPCSNRLQKKMQKWAERTQDSHHNRRQQVLNMFGKGSCREVFTRDGSPDLSGKPPPNTNRTQLSPLSSTPRILPRTTAKTTNWCPKFANIPQKHGKNEKLMSNIDQKRVLISEKFQASRIKHSLN